MKRYQLSQEEEEEEEEDEGSEKNKAQKQIHVDSEPAIIILVGNTPK